ncbi:hypothetical protein [Devosia sp. A449]
MPKTITPYELNGQRFTLGQWASIYGVPVGRVTTRVRSGWSLERALTEPVSKQTITYRNQTLTLSQWSDKTGLTVTTIRQRVKYGWPPAAVLTTPARFRSANNADAILTHNGETLPIEEWAKRLGIKPHGLRNRLRKGWSIEEALTTPCLVLQRPSRTHDRGEGSDLAADAPHRSHSIVRDLA